MKRPPFFLFHSFYQIIVFFTFIILIMTMISVFAEVPGGIQGTLKDPDGSMPVQYGWIEIEDMEEQPWMGTDTDPNGFFSISNLPQGNYILNAYPPEDSEYSASLPVEVEVVSGQFTTTTIYLTHTRISGWVQDSGTGNRIEGAIVVAHDEEWTIERWAVADINGNYKIGGVDIGVTYILEVFAPPETEYVQLPIDYTAIPIETGKMLEMHIVPINIIGRVQNPEGANVPEACVIVNCEDYWEEINADESGDFIFRGLPTGEFQLHAEPPWGVEGLIESEPIIVNIPTSETMVEVGAITLPFANKRVTGKVVFCETNNGVSNAIIWAKRLDEPRSADTPTDPNGRFNLSLTGGEWYLAVDPLFPPVDWFFPGPPVLVFFDINPEPETKTLVLEVIPTNAAVIGRIVCPDGEPCEDEPPHQDIRIEIRNDEIGNSTELNPEYGFILPIPDGRYEMIVHIEHPEVQGPEPWPVSVSPGQTLNIGDIALLLKDATIKGRVYNESGDGVPWVFVAGRQPEGFAEGFAETDPNGDYIIPVIGGEWLVEPQPGPELPYVMRRPASLVSVASGGTMAHVNFLLTSAEARITGTAIDAKTGTPLCGLEGEAWAEQIISQGKVEFFSSAPLTECNFEIKVQGDKEYNIGLELPPYAPYVSGSTGPVLVPRGGIINIQVPLVPKDALIEGQLKDALTGEPPTCPIWAEVFGEDDHGHWVSTMVDPESAGYSLGVVSGNWDLRLRLDPDSGYMAEPATFHVTIEPEQVIPLEFEIWPINSYISGQVLNPGGSMPIQAIVFVEGESPFLGYFEASGESDQNGNFELVVPEGKYIVRATLPTEQLIELGWLNPPPFEDANVSATSPATNLELFFRALDGEISGNITFAPNISVNPTHPAHVWGWTESGERMETEAIVSEMDANTFEYTLPVVKNTVWHVGAVYEDSDNGSFYESPEVPVPVLPTTGLAKKDLVLSGPWPLPQPFIISFDGTQMQTIVLPDGVEIRIPPRALVDSAHSQTVTLYIFPTKEIHPEAGKKIIGTIYEIWAVDENGQEITQFYKNIVMIFHYPPDTDLAQLGISEYLLMPVYYSDLVGQWVPADSYVVDTFHNDITLQISYFARFALMANKLIEYPEPDLDLSVLEFETPDSANPDQVLTEGLSLHIENRGTAASTELSIGIYLSEDPVISPDDILLTDGQQIVSGLEADSSLDVSLSDWMIRIPEDISEGPYYIGALVDNFGEIREKEEENNYAAIPIQVGVTSGDANLYVVSFKGPNSANTGQSVGGSISLKIGNNGQAAAGQFSVGIYYLFSNFQIPPWPLDQLLVGGRKTVYSLLPGASVQVPFDPSVSIPTGIAPGSYYIGVLIDDMEQVTETFESDNYKSNAISIKAADLYIESFKPLRYSAGPGQSMANYIKVRVGNKGQGNGSHSYNVGIYLSTDSTITNSDLLLVKGMVYLASLPSGAFVDIPFDQGMSIPSGVKLSDNYHYIGVLVDVYDKEAEDNENNNYQSSPFKITTDTWTVMAYLDGDCDREWQALDNLDQMEQVNQAGVPINLVALVDRHPNNPSGYKGGYSGDKVPSNGTVWSDTRWGPVRYDGTRKSFKTIMYLFDQNQPELNVADGKTLSSFILKMMEEAPAQHYALIVYDHGSMGGIARDDTSNDGGINMSEFKAAFNAVPHIDIVVLDACLMQDVEVATEMIDEVDYVMASQAERGAGMINLDKSLKWLQNNSNATPAQLAQRMFIEDTHDTGMPTSQKGCVSVIDINEVEELNKRIDAFATTAVQKATTGDWLMFQNARTGVEAFAWDSYLDLKEYMQNIVNNTSIPISFRNKAQDVISQVNKVVIHQKGFGTGLTINLPKDNTKIHSGYNGNGFTFVNTSHSHGTHWRDFLSNLPSNVYTVILGDLFNIDWGDFIIQAQQIDADAEQPVFVESMISETEYGPDVDFFQFTASPGQVLYADVYGNPANEGLMPVFTVYAPDMDTVLAQEVADENGVASIRSLNLPYQEGPYYLAVTSIGNFDPLQSMEGDTMGTYSLSMIFGEPEVLMPKIEVEPSSLSFGDIEIGSWGVKTINLTNTGGTLLEISSFELQLDSPELQIYSPFRAPDTPIILPINLGPGESFALSIGANPQEIGTISDVLRIISTDPNRPSYEVSLEAVGVESSGDVEFEMNMSAGWSMISLPVLPDNATVSELFPEAAVMYMYERESGYVRVQASEELQKGVGYWILVYEDQNYVLTGQPIPSYNKTVHSDGWEMIGGCTSGARPTADSCDIVVIYRFIRGAGYQRILDTEAMEPGGGFWILLREVTDQCELQVLYYP